MTQRYHFIGIGGIGMSALAKLVLSQGAVVSGSDQADSALLEELRARGARISIGHAARNVPAEGTVVVSDAIKEGNPELAAARAHNLPVIRRSELLGALMQNREGIAISGTHGKTTTTAMVARILIDAGLDPSVMVGGEALGPDRNARAGNGPHFLAEACEAYGSFLHLAPKIAVVTNIEPDHLDHHGDFENIRAAFRHFVSRIRPDGLLIVNADDPECTDLARHAACPVATYGLTEGDLRVADIEPHGMGTLFTVINARLEATVDLPVPGIHNVSNALAAFRVGLAVGLAPETIARALSNFHGVGRRFEYLGERDGVRVYDDYAHHPTEIRATLAAAREAFEGRVIAVFQPHLYSRTRDFMDEFIAAFDDADVVVITDIYKAREEPIPGVSAQNIVEGVAARCPDKETMYVPLKDDVPALLLWAARPGDVVFTIGAGNIRTAGESFLALPVEVPA